MSNLPEFKKEEAIEFFSDFFFGEHHFPSNLKEWGSGWAMPIKNSLSTYDYNHLTRLVLMAHDRCIRVEISPRGMNTMYIILHKRIRESDDMSKRHPTMEQAIEHIRNQPSTKKQ